MSDTRPCDACKRPTPSPRQGLCKTCYSDEPKDRIPLHGACASCAERRYILLRWTALATGRVLTCYNCGHVADVTSPKLADVPALKAQLARERRGLDRRRTGGPVVDGAGGRRKRVRRLPDRIAPGLQSPA